jgi:hypothetical protein
MATYKIQRFFQSDDEETVTVMTGLTLEKAQEHCQNPETSSSTATGRYATGLTAQFGPWFDGYTKEDG